MYNCYRITIITAIIVLVFSNFCFGQFSTPIQVTSTGGYHPSVSPNGEWVVFNSAANGLAKIKTDGTEFTQLTSMIQCYEPDWATHNDSLILFRHYDSTLGTCLLIINAFTLDTSFVFGGIFDDGATWAPDGSSIAVQNASSDGIRIISYPDTNITDVSCSDAGGVCDGEHPTWSPDGGWIAFEDGLEILKVQTTGGNAEIVVEGLGDASSPTWSPDGNWIAFTLDSGGYNHIWVADYRGADKELFKITGGQFFDFNPTWSPGSDTLYFERSDSFQYNIWKVPFSGIPTAINVSITGDDLTGDGSSSKPFATIQHGINKASEGDTILVHDGTYTGNGNRDIDLYGKEIVVMSINGLEMTTIDCQASDTEPHRGFYFHSGETLSSKVIGFKIINGYAPDTNPYGGAIWISSSNPTIENCWFENNYANIGGAILISGRSPIIKDCVFMNNDANWSGGSIFFSNTSAATLKNCLIAKNYSNYYGGGIGCNSGATPTIINCTIVQNEARIDGAGVFCSSSFPKIYSSIIAFNLGKSFECYIIAPDSPSDPPSVPYFSSSDVFGNLGGDWINCISGLASTDSNFSADPIFCDTLSNNYYLDISSPCAPLNNSSNQYIGAFDICIPTGIENAESDILPISFTIGQNYPNPFNPTTTIEFNLPTKSNVNIKIFNLLGQEVQQLVNQEYSTGNYKVTWDGKTSNGTKTSTGIYFYRIETDNFVETKKMLLLK